jgi:hypothetical protein
LRELDYEQDDFDFLRKVQESDIQADFKGMERNGIPNDKEKKIMTSGNSRKRNERKAKLDITLKKSKKEKKTDKKGWILNHLHEDVAGLKS